MSIFKNIGDVQILKILGYAYAESHDEMVIGEYLWKKEDYPICAYVIVANLDFSIPSPLCSIYLCSVHPSYSVESCYSGFACKCCDFNKSDQLSKSKCSCISRCMFPEGCVYFKIINKVSDHPTIESAMAAMKSL